MQFPSPRTEKKRKNIHNNAGLANTTYYRLGLDYSPTKDLSTSLDGFILRMSKAPAGESKNLGWEVDAKASYKVAKNLTYSVTAGYLDPGKAWGTDNQNITQLMHALTLSF